MRGKSLNAKIIGMQMALLMFFMPVGTVAEERADAGGQWAYVAEDGCAMITEGGYAGLCAKKINIPYILSSAETSETADESLIRQIDEYFTMTRKEIIEKLGSDYVIEPAGPEGACDGYYYEELGMAFAFYPDSDVLELIDCYPDFKIHGVGIGSLFPEILEALGDTEIIETWLELPIYTAFMVRYRFGNADYSFIAFEEDAPVHILWIQASGMLAARDNITDVTVMDANI